MSQVWLCWRWRTVAWRRGRSVLATCVTRLVHLWRRVKAAQTHGVPLPRAVPIALIVVPLAVMAARLALLEPTATWNRDRVIANAAEIIRDIEQFRERTGTYPVALSSLWPDYLPGSVGVGRYRYEPSGKAYNLYFEHPSTNFGAVVISSCITPAANRTSRATSLTCCGSRKRKSDGSAGTARPMTCRRPTGSGFSSTDCQPLRRRLPHRRARSMWRRAILGCLFGSPPAPARDDVGGVQSDQWCFGAFGAYSPWSFSVLAETLSASGRRCC